MVSQAGSVHAYIDPQLEEGESLEKYSLSSKWNLMEVVEGLWALILAFLLSIADLFVDGGFSLPDKVSKATLLALTNRRLIYSRVNMHSSELQMWMSPVDGSDEPMSLPLSEIKWAHYQTGDVNGRLMLRLDDDSTQVFYFAISHFGHLAEEIAELINVDKQKP